MMDTRQPQPSNHARLAAFATGAVMVAFAASRIAILDVPFEREFDEGVYLLSARSVAAGHSLFSSVFSSQPPAFIESLAVALRVFGDSLRTGRLFTLAFALVSIAAVAGISRRIVGAVLGPALASLAAPAAAAALALSITFGDLAHVVQAETPALAVALVSILACLHARERDWHALWLVAAGALFAAAALFKLIVLPMTAPLGLLLLLAPGRTAWSLDLHEAGFVRRVLRRSLFVAAGALAVACLPLIVYERQDLYDQSVAFHIAKHGAYGHSLLVNLRRIAGNLSDDATIVATAAAGLALLLWRSPLPAVWLLAWFAASVAAIVVQTPLFWRHFVLMSPPIALLAALPVSLAMRTLPLQARLVATLAFAALWVAPVLMLPGHRGAANAWKVVSERPAGTDDALSNVTAWIHDNTRPGDFVAGDEPIVIYLAGRQAPPYLCDTSQARILSGTLSLRSATRSSIKAPLIVLHKNGRLSHLRGYLDWLRQNYEQQGAMQTGVVGARTLWIRKDEEPRRRDRRR